MPEAMPEENAPEKKLLAIRLRKFNRVCPITGYREGSIRVGAPVVVQTDRGIEYGEIVAYTRALPHSLSRDVRLKKVIRYATPQDVEKMKALPELEAQSVKIANEKIREYELPVKIVNAECLFDASRVIIYYKPQEGKKIKNLRDITRDISTVLSSRVDLRQISSRDEARMFGGVGPCGRMLCCSVWLEKPKHVTVKMVKDQGLAISPTKTAGICGKLMCCLEYEQGK
jgi:cell fate regulator YaaT (PSP1 superfamily)